MLGSYHFGMAIESHMQGVGYFSQDALPAHRQLSRILDALDATLSDIRTAEIHGEHIATGTRRFALGKTV